MDKWILSAINYIEEDNEEENFIVGIYSTQKKALSEMKKMYNKAKKNKEYCEDFHWDEKEMSCSWFNSCNIFDTFLKISLNKG